MVTKSLILGFVEKLEWCRWNVPIKDGLLVYLSLLRGSLLVLVKTFIITC